MEFNFNCLNKAHTDAHSLTPTLQICRELRELEAVLVMET